MCLLFSKSNALNDDCGIVDYAVQLQLRICLSETLSEQSDAFPTNFSLCVNGTSRLLQVTDWLILIRFGVIAEHLCLCYIIMECKISDNAPKLEKV